MRKEDIQRAPHLTKWRIWLEGWAPLHLRLDPARERRIEIMLDILQSLDRSPLRVLDLGAGPGDIAGRVLERFPDSMVTAVDLDPAMSRIGKEALKRFGARITWITADIREVGGIDSSPSWSHDAVLCSQVLYGWNASRINTFYRDLHRHLRDRTAVLINDFFDWEPSSNSLTTVANRIRELQIARGDRVDKMSFAAEWAAWWDPISRDPEMSPEVKSRNERICGEQAAPTPLPLEVHIHSLREAGFRQVEVVWQQMQSRILLGFA
jgi:SAM-dependent methyltransferase